MEDYRVTYLSLIIEDCVHFPFANSKEYIFFILSFREKTIYFRKNVNLSLSYMYLPIICKPSSAPFSYPPPAPPHPLQSCER